MSLLRRDTQLKRLEVKVAASSTCNVLISECSVLILVGNNYNYWLCHVTREYQNVPHPRLDFDTSIVP